MKKFKIIILFIVLFSISNLANAESFTRTLKFGLRGDDVKALQTILVSQGYIKDSTNTTGYFGIVTKSALKQYQIDKKLKADGVAGKNTFRELEKISIIEVLPKEKTFLSVYNDSDFGFLFDYPESRKVSSSEGELLLKGEGSYYENAGGANIWRNTIQIFRSRNSVDLGNAHNGPAVISYKNGWIMTRDEGGSAGPVPKTITPVAYTDSGLPIFAGPFNSCSLPSRYAVALSENKFIMTYNTYEEPCVYKNLGEDRGYYILDLNKSESLNILKTVRVF